MIHQFWRAIAAFLVGVIIATAGANANGLEKPKGTVLLTVSGAISKTNAGETARFDLAMLEAIDSTVIETTTIWTDGIQHLRGVSLAALTKALGVNSGTLRAKAINDYVVEIPVTDAVEGGPIIAYELNGEQMPLRNKGPLWIVYPFDTDVAYKSEQIYTRSIWQLDRIEVVQ
ncbi:oxidoreductase [Sedimentitalea sp.]|uniref:oxidoreductase n=1 Tax=Sedimentitalea sp. TaxID=2048915 RepID=UPI003299E018